MRRRRSTRNLNSRPPDVSAVIVFRCPSKSSRASVEVNSLFALSEASLHCLNQLFWIDRLPQNADIVILLHIPGVTGYDNDRNVTRRCVGRHLLLNVSTVKPRKGEVEHHKVQ